MVPEGSPAEAKLTAPEKQFTGLTVTVYVAGPPAMAVVAPDTDRVKSGGIETIDARNVGAVPLPAVAVNPGPRTMEVPAVKLTGLLPVTVKLVSAVIVVHAV